MFSDSLVTVICLCYNHEAFVVETLQSVRAQTHKNIELFIVDDCSTDNSVNVIEEWLIKNPEVVFIKNSENLGNTKSFNKAAALAKGRFLIDLACDDLLLPTTIAEQLSTFSKYDFSQTAIVYGNATNIDESGNFKSYYFPVDTNFKVLNQPPSGSIYTQLLQGGLSMCSVSAMLNKSIFEKLKGYDESLAYEDLDYWIRASRNYKVYYEDTLWAKKRQLPTSLGSSFAMKRAFSKKMTASTLKIFKKAFTLNQNKTEDKALLKRVHYEIKQCLHRRDFTHLVCYILLKIRIQNRRF